MAMISCPECNKDISDKAKSCPHCGSPVTKAVAVIACSECGKEVPGKAKSCPHCGNPISGGADEAKAAAARAADAVTKALTAGGKSAFWVGFLMASWGGLLAMGGEVRAVPNQSAIWARFYGRPIQRSLRRYGPRRCGAGLHGTQVALRLTGDTSSPRHAAAPLP